MPYKETEQRLVQTIYKAFKELCEMHGIKHLSAFCINGNFILEDLGDLKNPKIKVFIQKEQRG